MRTDHAGLTRLQAEKQMQQHWDAFCMSGSVPDYLAYRECCTQAEGISHADTSDREGTDPA